MNGPRFRGTIRPRKRTFGWRPTRHGKLQIQRTEQANPLPAPAWQSGCPHSAGRRPNPVMIVIFFLPSFSKIPPQDLLHTGFLLRIPRQLAIPVPPPVHPPISSPPNLPPPIPPPRLQYSSLPPPVSLRPYPTCPVPPFAIPPPSTDLLHNSFRYISAATPHSIRPHLFPYQSGQAPVPPGLPEFHDSNPTTIRNIKWSFSVTALIPTSVCSDTLDPTGHPAITQPPLLPPA